MDKIDIISKLKQEKIVAVIRTESTEKCEKIVESIVQGGINFIEITMTVPRCSWYNKRLIRKI